METLNSDALQMIFKHCGIDDRLNLEMVNSRFRACVPYTDVKVIDIPYFEKISRRPGIGKSEENFWSSRGGDEIDILDKEYDQFLLALLKCIIPKCHQLEGLRFATKPGKVKNNSKMPETGMKIEWKILHELHELNPEISKLDFGNCRVRIEALKMLPFFKNLQRLSIYDTTGQFYPTLRQLRLTSLEIGGGNSPIVTADGSLLRRLVLLAPYPRRVVKNEQYLLRHFPNLEELYIDNGTFQDWKNPAHDYFADVNERVAYLDQFQKLRRSNLFGCRLVNLASMVSYGAAAVPSITRLNIELPGNGFRSNVVPNGNVVAHEQAALAAIRLWPRFFDNFQTIKSIRIVGSSHLQLNFGVSDLFYLAQFENLKTLIIDGVDFEPLNDAGKQFLERMKVSKPGGGSDVLFRNLKKLSMELSKHSPSGGEGFGEVTSTPSMLVYDVFTTVVLANCNALKYFETNYVTGKGWSALIDYAKRQGNRCPLEAIRIRCDGCCTAIPLPSLAIVRWVKLKELNVWCEHSGRSAMRRQHSTWATTPLLYGIGDSFPNLRNFRWPEPQSTPEFFSAVLVEFRHLQEIELPLPNGLHVSDYFGCIPPHPSLELLKLVSPQRELPVGRHPFGGWRLMEKKPSYVPDKGAFMSMVEKRNAILKMQGLRPVTLKVQKERMKENLYSLGMAW